MPAGIMSGIKYDPNTIQWIDTKTIIEFYFRFNNTIEHNQ